MEQLHGVNTRDIGDTAIPGVCQYKGLSEGLEPQKAQVSRWPSKSILMRLNLDKSGNKLGLDQLQWGRAGTCNPADNAPLPSLAWARGSRGLPAMRKDY